MHNCDAQSKNLNQPDKTSHNLPEPARGWGGRVNDVVLERYPLGAAQLKLSLDPLEHFSSD